MAGLHIINLISLPFFLTIPLVVLYYIIKLAVKNAIKEVQEEQSLVRKLSE